MKRDSATPARAPNFVEPMKAKLVDAMPTGDWVYEIKFDGYRALALRGGNETRVLSRNEKDLGGKFPEIQNSVAALDVQNAIIDGEIVALDDRGRSSFQLLQGFDMGLGRPPIVFYAFDLLRLNCKDVHLPFAGVNCPFVFDDSKTEGEVGPKSLAISNFPAVAK
jgi:bifunctional non-homologous end joining protein LigD